MTSSETIVLTREELTTVCRLAASADLRADPDLHELAVALLGRPEVHSAITASRRDLQRGLGRARYRVTSRPVGLRATVEHEERRRDRGRRMLDAVPAALRDKGKVTA